MEKTKLTLVTVAIAALFGCTVLAQGPGTKNKADLIPVPDPRPGYGFCKLVPSGPDRGKLIVTVKNQGRANAPASKTTVEFTPGGGIKIPTPAIPAGSSVALPPVAIPAAAWQPDAHFKIRVNSDAKVDESNNNNNTGTGTCIG